MSYQIRRDSREKAKRFTYFEPNQLQTWSRLFEYTKCKCTEICIVITKSSITRHQPPVARRNRFIINLILSDWISSEVSKIAQVITIH